MSDVETSLASGVLTLTLARPSKRNALTSAMYAALTEALRNADENDDVRVVVLRGSGGSFTAGNDLGDFLRTPPRDDDSPGRQFLHALADATVPLLAAVDGAAVGIGTTLLLHCDFVLATPSSRFALPFVDLGLVPEAGASLLLPRLVGYRRAAELLMLGEPFDADTALELGIVGELVDQGELDARTEALATALARKPPRALRETKTLLRRDADSLTERIDRELETFFELLASSEAQGLIAGVLGKR